MEKNISFAIRELRKRNALAQHEFGQRIGVSDSAVSCWESGRRIPREKEVKKICKEFGVDYNYLFGVSNCENSEIIDDENTITIPLFDRTCKNQKTENYTEFLSKNKSKKKYILPLDCFAKKQDGYFSIFANKNDTKLGNIKENDLLIFRAIINKNPKRSDIVCCINNGKLELYSSDKIKGTILGVLSNVLTSY